MDKIRELLQKYREQAAYVFFGGLTTLVNIVAYFVADSVLHMATVPRNRGRTGAGGAVCICHK